MIPVRPLNPTGAMPRIRWHWEPETDILSGSFDPEQRGKTGTVELSDADGAVAVLDLRRGLLHGVDIVVWPEVVTIPGLVPPPPDTDGGIEVLGIRDGRGAGVLQADAALAMAVDPAEQILHLRVGPVRPVHVVRAADHLAVEIDRSGLLAGLWLTGVPPFPLEL